MAKERSAEEWEVEVAAWRASGESARAYARRRGYSASSLFRRARELGAPTFVRLEVVAPAVDIESIALEIAGATIRVKRGFDAELLRDVLSALAMRGPK